MIKIDMKYFNTYYFCYMANNLITTNDLDYAPLLSEFDTMLFEVEPSNFSKNSVLHTFCNWMIDRFCFESLRNLENEINLETKDDIDSIDLVLSENHKVFFYKGFLNNDNYKYTVIELAIQQYCGHYERLRDWIINNRQHIFLDEITASYIEYLNVKGMYYDLINKISNEVVYILFKNREFLYEFNSWLAEMHNYEIPRKSPPKWVQRAAYHREKGRCVICNKDLSGIIDIEEDFSTHLDHIVPIESGGLNDFSNMQLMCKHCNLQKGTKAYTNSTYRFWYDLE